jgi:Tol biopolymer transport system component
MFLRRLIVFALGLEVGLTAQNITPLSDYANVQNWLGSPTLSPDGKTLAFDGGGIWLRPFSGGPSVRFAKDGKMDGLAYFPLWSPNGPQIAFLRNYCHHCPDRVLVKSRPRGEERSLGEVCQGVPSWTPDGRYLIGADRRGKTWDEECSIALIPVDGSPRIKLLANEGDRAAVSPDGKRLAYAAGHLLKRVNLTADYRLADRPVVLADEPYGISSIHWLPDGHTIFYQVWANGRTYSRLVSAFGDRTRPRRVDVGGNISVSQILADGTALGTQSHQASAMWRIDLQSTAQVSESVRTIPWTDSDLTVSPDGQSLVFATNRNGPTQIWISRFDGSQPRVLVPAIPPLSNRGENTQISAMSWSPDGKWIALLTDPGVGHGDEDAQLSLVPAAGGRFRVLFDCSLGTGSPAWTSDSKAIYVVKTDQTPEQADHYFLVDVATGKETAIGKESFPASVRNLAPLPSGAQGAHLAQDGRFVYFVLTGEMRTRMVLIKNFLPGAEPRKNAK